MASKWRFESGKIGHLRAMLGDPAFEYIVQKNEKLDSRSSNENDNYALPPWRVFNKSSTFPVFRYAPRRGRIVLYCS